MKNIILKDKNSSVINCVMLATCKSSDFNGKFYIEGWYSFGQVVYEYEDEAIRNVDYDAISAMMRV